MRNLVHFFLVDPDGLCRERACGATDGHQNAATVVLKNVTCVECLASHFFPQRAA